MEKTLKQKFFEGLDAFNSLDGISEAINSNEVQLKIKKIIKLFEECTEQVSELCIFSVNEDMDEMSTNDLPFFLLPALLGLLTLKLCYNNRIVIIDVAEIYFKDFLNRCSYYGLTDYDSKKIEELQKKRSSDNTNLLDMIKTRMTKIARYKEKKRLRENMAALKSIMDKSENEDDNDDNVTRKYYISLIQLFIHQAIEELDSIDAEKPLIEYRRSEQENDLSEGKHVTNSSKTKSLSAVIIAKDQVQKLVFGDGYPSLPVMTVDEFYEKRVREGIFPGPNCSQKVNTFNNNIDDDHSDAIREQKLENDDNEFLEGLRKQDDFKDEHRRGWGNRLNRS